MLSRWQLVTTNTVLEWKPFVRYASENTGVAASTSFLSTVELEPTEKGTRVMVIYGDLRGPAVAKIITRVVGFRLYRKGARRGMERMDEMIRDDIAAGRLSVPNRPAVVSDVVESAARTALEQAR